MSTALHPTKSARPAPRFRLTTAKRKTLELIAEYFCLRVCDVAKLLRNREPDENDLRTARRTLQLLSNEGLLNRLPYFELDRLRGNISYVYGLSDKGVKHIGDLHTVGPKTFDEHSARTLDHELEISYFHMALKRFTDKHGLKLYWQQVDLKTDHIHPDAYFAITDPAKPEGKNTYHYFLEIERSKIGNYKDGQPSILRKLSAYYKHFDTNLCEKDWGFKQFRIIVVQRTEERMENLLTTLSEDHKHRMFWLTTEGKYKQDIGAEIFKTPKDFEKVDYSFTTL
jgi:hypothetical protein